MDEGAMITSASGQEARREARRFLADRMLARLARWLRVAGEDVISPALPGSHEPTRAGLARLARIESRTVVTRDRTFPLPRHHRLLILATDLDSQLREFYRAFPADPLARLFTRCSLCNGLTETVALGEVVADVPAVVRERGRDFRRCLACGQVYWEGSHTAHIRARLGALDLGAGSRPIAPLRPPVGGLAVDDHRGWARFDDFLRELLSRLDLSWSGYRKPRRHLRSRLVARMAALGIESYAGYLDHVTAHPEEEIRLTEILGVTISRFFRDREDWFHLAETALPALAALGRAARAASLGCASGEEPYTLRLLWNERWPAAGLDILAVDVREEVLERARTAAYPPASVHSVPADVLARRFAPEATADGTVYRLAPALTAGVRFVRRDFMREPLPAPLDLILCRNVAFTYLGAARQRAMAERFAAALRPGGYLMIGGGERLPAATGGLERAGRCLYRKAAVA